jgi:tetratricopeptide (TPR) repeat protein
MAKIAQEGMDDTAKAATYYAQILDVEPGNMEALSELESIYRITERWEDLLGILERRREMAGGDELTDVVLETGKVQATYLGRADEAIECFAFVLENRPGNREAVEALEALMGRDEHRLRVAELLDPHLSALEKFSQLVTVKRILLDATQEGVRRQELLFSLADVHVENLSDSGEAYEILCQALAEFPGEESVWDRLENLAGLADRWDDVRQRFHGIFEGDEVDDDVRQSLARRLAGVCEERLHDPLAAEGYHRWIFERDSLDEISFSALEAIYTNADRYEDLRGLYRERVRNLADASAKIELLQKIGYLEEDLLEKVDGAIDTYREMLDLEPDNELALRALERLYENAGRWADLAELLEAHLDEVPEDAIVAARYRLGDILDQKLGEHTRALDYYRMVLDQYPTHLKSQEALERLLDDQELRQEAASILEGIYESQGAHAELARVLAIRLEGTEDDMEKVDLLLKLAEIQDKRLHDGDGAYETLARAFRIDPANEQIRAVIEMTVEENDLWPVYADELEEISGRVEDESVLGPILFALGNIYLTRTGNEEQALAAFNKYLSSGHDEAGLVVRAAKSLETLYASRESYSDLVRVLSLQLEHLDTQEERVENLRRVGEIQEVHLEAVEEAIQTYLDIIDMVPDDTESVFSLERLYERAGKWEELIGILQRRAESGVGDDEALQISFKVAEIYKEKLENLEEAIFTYLSITERSTSREALEALVDLYDKTGAERELVDTLDRVRELSDDPAEQASLLYRIGEVERERAGDFLAAVDRYRSVLDIDGSHAEAREALEGLAVEEEVRLQIARILAPLYEQEQNYERLLEMVDVEIVEEQDPMARDRLFKRAAEVSEVGLADPVRAFGYHARALRQVSDHPESASAVDDLERITAETTRWSDLVELYSQVAPDIYDPELQLRLYLRIAQLQLGEMENPEAAKDWYVKVLDIAADSVEAVEALERIYWQMEEWSDLLEILKRKTDLNEDPGEKVSLLFQQAEICEEKLGDVAMAIEAYESILEMEENRDAVHALERLYSRAERWGNYRDIIERQLEWPDAEEVVLHHRLGQILAENLGDPQAALEHFQEALRLDPKHEPTVEILETWLDDSSFREQVAELLEPIYLSQMRFDKVQSIIQVRLEFMQEPAMRKELFQRSGEIYEEQLEDLEKAFSVYVSMFAEDPEDHEVRANVDRLGNVLDIWPSVAEAYQKVLDDRLTEDEVTAELARHVGMVYDNYCGDPEGAVRAFKRALNINSADQDSFNSLEAIYHREEQWENLFSLYRDVADSSTDMEVRRNILYLMGQLCEEKLVDRGRAIDIYREVLDIQADDPMAIGALERLYYYEERFHDLSELLHFRIDRADNAAEQLELKYRLATVYDEHLDDRATAVDLCEEILHQDPSYRDAVAALENILADPDHRLRVAQILIPHYRQVDDWHNLVGAYKAELEFLSDPVDRMERLREIAELSETRGSDSEGAMAAYADALLEDPDDADILGHLQRIASDLGRWGDLVQILSKALEKTDMSSVRSGLLRLSARILDRHLGDFNEAVSMYKRLLEEEEGDMEALEALDSLYTLLSDWEGLLEAIDLKVQYTIDQEAAKSLRRRQGEVCEDQLGNTDRAIGYYVQALEADPSDLVTLENLERLYEQAERWQDLDGVLQQKLSGVMDAPVRREVLLKIAAVHQEKLEDFEQAISAYLSVIEEFPEDIEVMKVLDSLFAHEERWDDLYQNLERRTAVTQDADEVIGIQLQMGQLLTEALGDVERAIDIYRRILDAGDNPQAFDALEEIAQEEEHRVQVISILEPIYRRAGSWENLLNLQKLQLEILSDPSERVELFMQIADLYERGLADREKAFTTYLDALGEEVWNEDLYRHAETMAEQLDRWSDFAGVLDEKAGSVFDATVSTDLNMRLGRIWEERLGDLGKAIESYRRILDQGGDETEALDALDRLYYQQERWQDLVDVIAKKLDASTDVDAQNVLSLRLGEIRDRNFDDVPGAVRAYSEVLERSVDNQDAISSLEALLDREKSMDEIIEILTPAYRASGNVRKLIELLDLKASILEMPEERVAVLREEAQIAEEELQDPEAAFQAFGKALWETPEDGDLMDELERLSEMLGGWEALSEHVGRILEEQNPEGEVRKHMMLKLAGWAKNRIQDPESATRWYGRYLEAEPEDLDALREYEESLEAMGRDEELLDVLERRESLEYDFEEKKVVLQRIAEIATSRVADMDRAARAYESLVGLDETDLAAVDALMGIKTEREDWDGVIELTQLRLMHTADPVEANAHRHRLVELLRTVKEDSEQAIEVLGEILSTDPEDERAASMLEELYEAEEKWFDLKELILSRMNTMEEAAIRVHTYKRLSDLSENRFEDLDEAVQFMYEAYRLDPMDPDVLDGLERLLVATERLDDLISLLEQRATEAASSDPEAELALLVRIGEIYHGQLEDAGRAVEYYEKVLERDSNHVLALNALADLHEQAGEWEKCISVLDKASQHADTQAMGEIFYRIGTIKRERMDDVSGALESFNAVLEVYPEHPEIMDTLKGYFEAEEDWGRYASILEVEERMVEDVGRKLELLLELAGIMRERLEAPDQALGYLEQANDLRPGDVDVLTALVDSYILAGRTTDAIPLLENLIEAEEQQSGKRSKKLAVFHHRLGQAHEVQGDKGRAVEEYEKANRIDLTNFEVNFSLGQLYMEQGNVDGAMKMLRPLLLQNLADSGIDKADVYYLLGQLHLEKGEKPKAISMLERGLTQSHDHEGIKELLKEIKG